MGVPAYMMSVKNVPAMFEAIQNAGVPERFTHEFLKQLGFASSNDRSVIPVMKSLRFLDENGAPTSRYRDFRDPSMAGGVMAEALRDAYGDLFKIHENANALPGPQLKGAFLRLSEKGDSVAEKLTATFRALAKLADWAPGAGAATKPVESSDDPEGVPTPGDESQAPAAPPPARLGLAPALHHDVHVHLPTTTDVKVYDAIFRSLREHFG